MHLKGFYISKTFLSYTAHTISNQAGLSMASSTTVFNLVYLCQLKSYDSLTMDFIFDCFFEEILATIERSGLKTRQNRQNVIDQLDSVISGCSSGKHEK